MSARSSTEDTGRSTFEYVGMSIAVIAVSLTVMIAFSGAAAAFHASDTQTVGDGVALDHNENHDDDHSHQDDPPENNPNPEDPPCDANHGHPANNSEECDEDDPGNSNGSNGNGNGPDDGNGDDGNGDDGNGDDGNGDNGNETDGDLGTCEQDGLVQNETIANSAFGTENEEGPISSELHANEEQFQELGVVVHEGSCVVATIDNNA